MEFDEKGNQKFPSFIQMAKNFSTDLAKYIAEGQPNVSQEDYEARLEACNTCPHLARAKKRCTLCGCYLEEKAKWRTAICPDEPSRWKWQDPEPQTEEEKVSHAKAMESAKKASELYEEEKKKKQM